MTEQTEEFQIDLNNVPVVESKGDLIDVKNYEGSKWKIEIVEVKKEMDPFHDELGNPTDYNPQSKAKCFKAYVFTEPLKKFDKVANKFTDEILTITGEDGKERPIRVRAKLNLQTSKAGTPEVSKHPKANAWKFMRKMGANTLPELKGKIVMLDSEPSKVEGDDRKYLRIVTQ